MQIQADPMRLRQALDNLLDNAICHGPDAGGLIRVEAAVSGQVATVTIENAGPGFDDELLLRAFEPFVRGGDAERHPGAGLGLAIVRAVAQAHGGSATAENVAGGARLTMTLALDARPHPDPGPGPRPGVRITA
jgi:signal transduction histidine kinase